MNEKIILIFGLIFFITSSIITDCSVAKVEGSDKRYVFDAEHGVRSKIEDVSGGHRCIYYCIERGDIECELVGSALGMKNQTYGSTTEAYNTCAPAAIKMRSYLFEGGMVFCAYKNEVKIVLKS